MEYAQPHVLARLSVGKANVVSHFKTAVAALLSAVALAATVPASAQDQSRDRTLRLENGSRANIQRRRALRTDPPSVRGFRNQVPSMRNAEPSSPIYDYLLSRPASSTLVAPMR